MTKAAFAVFAAATEPSTNPSSMALIALRELLSAVGSKPKLLAAARTVLDVQESEFAHEQSSSAFPELSVQT